MGSNSNGSSTTAKPSDSDTIPIAIAIVVAVGGFICVNICVACVVEIRSIRHKRARARAREQRITEQRITEQRITEQRIREQRLRDHEEMVLWIPNITQTFEEEELVERVKRNDVSFLVNELYTTAAKWREIGMGLGFVYGELNNIAATGPGFGPEECLVRMLADWAEWPNSRHKDLPTMDKLCEVLRTFSGALANELEAKKNQLPSSQERNYNRISGNVRID
jgi:hypothetical protein